MANLQSPGVQVQVIDESFYLPAAPGTTPMIFVASAQDKTNPSGNIAQGTSAANAGKVWLITSQRDLTDTFGTPVFYTDASGNPQHGGELNEYGLQAAYSLLGVSSRAYVVRADLDTTQLVPLSSAPTGDPVPGTFWVDTDASVYGIKEWNLTTQKFTVKTPIVLDDASPASSFDGVAPASSVGNQGDYCLVLTSTNIDNKLYYKSGLLTWTLVEDGAKKLTFASHINYPNFTNTATGSVWITTTTPSNGANWNVKYYSGSSQSWVTVAAPLYPGVEYASVGLDSTGGGKNIPVGSVFVDTDFENNGDATFKLWRRNSSGQTVVTGNASSNLNTGTYYLGIRYSSSSATGWTNTTTSTWSILTIDTNVIEKAGKLVADAITSLNVEQINAVFNSGTNLLTIKHLNGGDIELAELSGDSGNVISASGITTLLSNVYQAPSGDVNQVLQPGTSSTFITATANVVLSNWKPLSYDARPTAPTTDPADGTLWYNSVVDEVDVMYHNGTTWVGYHDATAFTSTDPAGPIVSALEPTEQSDGSPLVNGDIWVSTADLDRFGRDIYVHNGTSWVLQDVTDQSTPDGWLFADARWATAGTTLTASSITDLLSSNYLDPDAPDPALYPKGMRLWNTRRSGFNVKKYITGYINTDANGGANIRFGNQSMGSYKTDRWVSQYPITADGGPQFGRLAQRAQVVNAMKELIDSNLAIRDTDTLVFNLLATPGYPETIQNMISFNTDRKLTAFVVGDTPFRLLPNGTDLSEWGLNTNGALDNGDLGATSFDEYMAMYYPSGFTNDNTGNNIVVPASHMMLRTIINSDAKSYPWFAPAGTRRGGVDNATAVGYINAEGEFKPVALYEGLRDVLQDPRIAINPIATLTGVGVLAYGQRTRARNASALDRINVARLVVYLRRQLDILARPFLFEPNDAQTRREIKAAAESLLLELVGQRALYDFIVVCDESNNTPARIDRNELWLDLAIEPVKAIEFIYIPLRLKNTGDIAAGL